MRAVLDANGLISALIRPQGPPGRILFRFLRNSAFELVVSPATLDELRLSLGYRKLQKYLSLRKEEADLWVDSLAALAVIVEGKVSRRFVTADPADDIYIAAAIDGLADFIVSGDRHLLDLGSHGNARVVSPRAFLDLLGV